MRYLLAISALLFAVSAWSQPVKGNAPESAGVPVNTPADTSQKENGAGKKEAATSPQPPLLIPLHIEVKPSLKEPISAKEQEDAAQREKDDLKAQQDQASYAFILIWVSGITGVLLFAQVIIFGIQVKGARREFLSVHRPKIRVKLVWNSGELWMESELKIHVQVVNTGLSAATITRYGVKVFDLQSNALLPQPPNYGDAISGHITKLESGVSADLNPVILPIKTDRDHSRIRGGLDTVYCIGYIEYSDPLGNIRTTGFIRKMAIEDSANIAGAFSNNGVFVKLDPEKSTDYEYED